MVLIFFNSKHNKRLNFATEKNQQAELQHVKSIHAYGLFKESLILNHLSHNITLEGIH